MLRNLIVRVLWVFLTIAPAFAQDADRISGAVVDPDHAAISRAMVTLLAPDGAELARTLTDRQGRFTFQKKCSAGCSVEIQLTGFQTRKLATPLPQPNIELAVAPVQESIVVTANRMEVPSSQVGATITIISREEITDKQSLMTSDLLQTVPGATVLRSGAVGATTSLFIRGGESD